MNRKPGLYASGIILLFMFALAAWAWPQVPPDAQIPVHWNASGTPNGFAGKLPGLLAIPLIAAALAGLFVLIPAIEPRRCHLFESGKPYTVTWVAVLGLMAVLQLATVLYALGSVAANLAQIIPYHDEQAAESGEPRHACHAELFVRDPDALDPHE